MQRGPFGIALVLVAAILCSCKSTPLPQPFPYEGVYSGYYVWGFEVSAFYPQGARERWWLVRHGKIDLHELNGSEVYLAVRGTLTPKGKYGHLGGYDRELYVTDVIELTRLPTRPRRF